ncbi:MAG: DUF4364 family protein [Clostridium sp.]|nr:DUF4364 family protein [Clostridium sp.]
MDKEFNPNLEFDAFTAGIEDGGLRSSSSITILVCYILANCKEKITAEIIIDALTEGKIANYFEVSSAISKMLNKEHFTVDEDGYLVISEDCKFAVDIVEKDLPITIRERSIALVRKLAVREIYKKENKVEITEENESYQITMHVSDVDRDFMKLTLNVPTMAQAELIKEKFQQNPAKIYENLMNSIFE